jgi:hypothetical protein
MVERQLPKLDVAGSIPVARSNFQSLSELIFKTRETLEPSRETSRKFSLRNCQPPEVKLMRGSMPGGSCIYDSVRGNVSRSFTHRILSLFLGYLRHSTTRYQVVYTDVSAVKASYVWLGTGTKPLISARTNPPSYF